MPTTMDIAYKVDEIFKLFVKGVEEIVLDGLDLDLAGYLIDTLEEMCDALVKKKEEDGCDDIARFSGPYIRSMLIMVLRSFGVFYAFSINSKEDPENIKRSKS